MKKIIAVTASVLAVSMLAATGCGNKNSKNVTSLYSNWYSFTTFKKIQPTHMGEKNAEIIHYDIDFEKLEGGNSAYSVEYGKGDYTTTFYAVNFDIEALTHADYKKGYEDALKKSVSLATPDEKAICAYYYKTERYLPSVRYVFKNEKSEEFSDSLVTECYFLSVENKLRPLYSKQQIVSHTPDTYGADSLSATYKTMDRTVVTYYNYAGTEAKTTTTLNAKDSAYKEGKAVIEKTHTELDKTKNSLFDLSSLDIVIRANNLTPNLAQTISLLLPESGAHDYVLRGAEGKLKDEEKASVTAVLKEHGLYVPEYNDKNEEKGLKTVAVSLRYNSENSGTAQTYWFAAINSKTNNTSRATLVKFSTPVAYGLGTLNYTLTAVNNTLKA